MTEHPPSAEWLPTAGRDQASAVDANDLPVGVIRMDLDDRIVAANDAFESWMGAGPAVGRSLSDLLIDGQDFLDDAESVSRVMVSASDPDRAAFVIRRRLPDGSMLTVMDASDRLMAGRRLRQYLTLVDRTRSRLELVIEASIAFSAATSESRLAEILVDTTERAYAAEESVVFLLDSDGHLELVAGTDPFGVPFEAGSLADAVRGLHQVLKVSGVSEGDALDPSLGRVMRESGVQSLIVAPIHHDGVALGVFATFFHHPRQFDDEASPLADALAGQAGQTLTTIRLQRQLEHAAMHDETTGLPNRRMLEERTTVPAGQQQAAVVFIDLDGFKQVNDRLGHDQGDEVLREVGSRLREAVREDDVIARYGGDEFVVVSEVVGDAAALEIAERIRLAVASPLSFLPDGMQLSASIGVCVTAEADGDVSIDSLIRSADQAMYRAKARGGDQIELCRADG